jgi:type IV pilus assembly protein PilV
MRPVLWRTATAQRPERPGSGQAGLTLVDVMVAMVIMALGLLALAASIPLASTATQGGWQGSQAAAIAEDVFERMRTTTYANINSTNFPNQASVAGYEGFSYTITFADGTPVAGARTVTVTVRYTPLAYQAGQGSPVNVSLSTIFAAP